MNSLNRALVTIVGLGWLSFLGVGWGIRTWATPSVVVLVERSYCPPDQWQPLVNAYADLYQQHQQKRIQIDDVILFSSLGQESLAPIPTPNQLQDQTTYGPPAAQTADALRRQYPQAELLNCR